MKRAMTIIAIIAINLLLISSAYAQLNITILNAQTGDRGIYICEEEDFLIFTVEGFTSECWCRRARVYLTGSGGTIAHTWVYAWGFDDRADGAFDLRGLSGQMRLWVCCDCRTGCNYIDFFRDTMAPTFTEALVGSRFSSWTHSPVSVRLDGFSDDGFWENSEYSSESWLDGRYQGTSPGAGTILYDVDEGRHTVQIRVEDKCGHSSGLSESVEFFVDNRAPSVYFVDPEEDEMVFRSEYLTVRVRAGDPGFNLDKVSGFHLFTFIWTV